MHLFMSSTVHASPPAHSFLPSDLNGLVGLLRLLLFDPDLFGLELFLLLLLLVVAADATPAGSVETGNILTKNTCERLQGEDQRAG